MNPLILTVRALSAEFVKRLALPIIIIGASIFVVLIALTIWLTTMSGWWGILLTLLIIGFLVFSTLVVIVGLIISAVNPRQNSSQKKAIKSFVDKLQSVAETIQTPKVVIVGRLVWDVINKNNNGLVRTLSSNTLSTKKDFDDIRKSFETTTL